MKLLLVLILLVPAALRLWYTLRRPNWSSHPLLRFLASANRVDLTPISPEKRLPMALLVFACSLLVISFGGVVLLQLRIVSQQNTHALLIILGSATIALVVALVAFGLGLARIISGSLSRK